MLGRYKRNSKVYFSEILKEDFLNIMGDVRDFSYLKSKSILITGANGFIASYLLNFILFANDVLDLNVELYLLLRSKDKINGKIINDFKSNKVTIIQQDVCEKIKVEGRVDFILHLASNASPLAFKVDPVGTSLPNIIGTKNLLDLAIEKNVDAFIFFSTTGVYGHNPEEKYPLREEDFGVLNPFLPESCYLESKRMGESLCTSYYKQYCVPVKVVRPAITFGPGIDLDGGRSYEDFINRILNGEDIILYSSGEAIRNFCYISDFISGLFFVLSKGNVGEAYNLATDEEISILELANNLVGGKYTKKVMKIQFKCAEDSQAIRTEFTKTTVNISKAKELGWGIKIPTLEGFTRTIMHYKEVHKYGNYKA